MGKIILIYNKKKYLKNIKMSRKVFIKQKNSLEKQHLELN